jgi:hypothetical protein
VVQVDFVVFLDDRDQGNAKGKEGGENNSHGGVIPASQRRLVTTHDAFQYYARAYGLDVIGTLIGISTEEQPSVQTVQKLVESIQRTEPLQFLQKRRSTPP